MTKGPINPNYAVRKFAKDWRRRRRRAVKDHFTTPSAQPVCGQRTSMQQGRYRYPIILLAYLLLITITPALGQTFNGAAPDIAPNEVIITLKPLRFTQRSWLKQQMNASGIKIKRRFKTLSRLIGRDLMILKSKTIPARRLKALLKGHPWVESVALNHRLYPLEFVPNDAYFDRQWAHYNHGQTVSGRAGVDDADIDTTLAWPNVENSLPQVIVAVIDTGIDYTHEDLQESIWTNQAEYQGIPGIDDDANGYVDDIYGVDTGDNDTDPMDFESHGTHVAGIIGATWNNGIGVAGVAPGVKVVAVKGFRSVEGAMYTSEELGAIDYVLSLKERGENIVAINASYGCIDCYETIERDAIENLCNAGILFITAAGNEQQNNDVVPSYPASYDLDCIITVAATDNRDKLCSFSNYGANSVHLAAPGWMIYSTDAYTGQYAYMSGTSMATAFVTGAAALISSAYPDEGIFFLKKRILKGVDPIASLEGKIITGGRLNVANSLSLPGPCWMDADGDGSVDQADIMAFLSRFGGPVPIVQAESSDTADGLDLIELIREFGRDDCL